MLKELLLDNDKVALPGLGSFMTELSPSTFSDKGYTINPPYRKLFFREHVEQDDMLVQLYASSNDVSVEVAHRLIVDFVSEMKMILDKQKLMVFPGLGRLRATKENNYFFIADAELDIYPEGFGLEAISLRNHPQGDAEGCYPERSEGTVDSSAVPQNDNDTQDDNETSHSELGSESAVMEPAVMEPAAADPATQEPIIGKKPGKATKTVLIALLGLVLLVALALIAFLLAAQLAPDFIDSILYNEAELEILNYTYGE